MTVIALGVVFLMGALLSVWFRFQILIFTAGLAIVGIACVGTATGSHIWAVMQAMAIVVAALQFGYLFGLVAGAVIASRGGRDRKAFLMERLRLRHRSRG
jgi:hypothetical protein